LSLLRLAFREQPAPSRSPPHAASSHPQHLHFSTPSHGGWMGLREDLAWGRLLTLFPITMLQTTAPGAREGTFQITAEKTTDRSRPERVGSSMNVLRGSGQC
jgi:hypothetical protein